ncbi:MAG TPA: DNA-processing protein DprA [Solirubrobacteraceae bacterium]
MSACDACLRRAWLVGELADHFERTDRRLETLRALLELGDSDLLRALVGDPSRRARLERARASFDAAAARSRCAAANVDPICAHDGERYPQRLSHIADAPAVLHVTGAGGAAALTDCSGVAIVGARRASAYGLETARSLGRDLAAAGVSVVSGMALGIDSAAHAGALEGGGQTIAVLPGGADVAYPPSKRALRERIVRSGCAVSELPPGVRPRRWCFPARNRLIAWLARLTIVVEAAQRSGALITARAAREEGRDVGAVPGRVSSPLAEGTNALLRDGAYVITDVQYALDVAYGVGARTAARHPGVAALEPRLRRVFDAVGDGRDTVGALAAGSGTVDEAMIALAELELLGHLRRAAGGRYVPVA